MKALSLFRGLRRTLAAACLVGFGTWGSGPASGQQLRPGLALPGRTPQAAAGALQPAKEFRPERVRIHLRSFHGFTQAQLEAASTDVPRILTGWIGDPGEPMWIRRQAIKALGFYPTEETFAFIAAQLPAAPAPLQMLFLHSLRSHAALRPARLEELAAAHLLSEHVVVRYAAVSLIGRLAGSSGLTRKLEDRLAVEPDPALRATIRETLAARRPR